MSLFCRNTSGQQVNTVYKIIIALSPKQYKASQQNILIFSRSFLIRAKIVYILARDSTAYL